MDLLWWRNEWAYWKNKQRRAEELIALASYEPDLSAQDLQAIKAARATLARTAKALPICLAELQGRVR